MLTVVNLSLSLIALHFPHLLRSNHNVLTLAYCCSEENNGEEYYDYDEF
jgi:hypothetical protein